MLCIVFRFGNQLFAQTFGLVQLTFLGFHHLLKTAFYLSDILALAFPIIFIAGNLAQVLVEFQVVLANLASRIVNHILRQTNLVGNLESKTATGLAGLHHKHRLHTVGVVKHCAIDNSVVAGCKMLQIGVVGCYHPENLGRVEFVENGLGNGTAQHWLGSGAKLVDKNQRAIVGILHKVLHIKQMRAVRTQIVVDALLVADIDENIRKNANAAVLVNRQRQSALKHILQ